MSEQVNLNAETRDVEGKSSSRQLRRAGSVPAVIYGGKEDPVRISILEKDIAKLLKFLVLLLTSLTFQFLVKIRVLLLKRYNDIQQLRGFCMQT